MSWLDPISFRTWVQSYFVMPEGFLSDVRMGKQGEDCPI